MDFLDRKMDDFGQTLESADVDDASSYSPEELVAMIEKILISKYGENPMGFSC